MGSKIYDPFKLLSAILPDEGYALNDEWVKDKAKLQGLQIVEADDNTLQLDFDSEEDYEIFISVRLPTLLEFIDVTRVWWTESKSGNKHVYVKLGNPLSVEERIAFQGALGSDPTRELLALIGVREGKKLSIVLFEKADAVEHVIFATDGYQPVLTDGGQQHQLASGA